MIQIKCFRSWLWDEKVTLILHVVKIIMLTCLQLGLLPVCLFTVLCWLDVADIDTCCVYCAFQFSCVFRSCYYWVSTIMYSICLNWQPFIYLTDLGSIWLSLIHFYSQGDLGSGYLVKKKWLSFVKARLNCSLPGKDPYEFNELCK